MSTTSVEPVQSARAPAWLDHVRAGLFSLARGETGWRVVEATAALGRQLGVEPDRLREEPDALFTALDPQDAARARATLDAADASTGWHAWTRVSGAERWLEWTATAHPGPDGALRWTGVCLDRPSGPAHDAGEATARDELLREYVRASPVSMAMLDRDLVYVAVSRRWADELGRGRDALLGAHHYEVHPDVPERWKEVHRAALRGEHLSADDELWVQRDGTRVWLRWAVHPWRRADGTIGGIVIVTEDVTARKIAEELLKKSEARYRALVDLCPDAVFVNRGGAVALVNQAMVNLLRAGSAEALLGRAVWDLLHPDDHGLIRERMRAVLAGEPVGIVPVRVVTVDGAAVTVESTAGPIDLDGPAILVVLRDVTERDRARAALTETERRLATVIHTVMDGVITIDERHVIVLANQSAEAMFGVTSGTLVGQPLEVLLPDAYRQAHGLWVREFARSGVTRRKMGALGHVSGKRADGTTIPLEASISRVDTSDGALLTVVLRDIRERLDAQHALHDQQTRFRELVESIHEVFWVTDPAREAFRFVGPAYADVWGRPCEALYADPTEWLRGVHPDDRDRLTAALAGAAVTGFELTYRVVRPDGAQRWVLDRAFPVRDAAGRTLRIVGVVEDISGRQRLEEQLRQTQKMDALGRLAGGVAHDFNNLLTVIVASAELLRETVGSDATARETLDDVLDASRRGAALTRQLLAFTRQDVVEPRVTSLVEVVRDVERLLARVLGEKVRVVADLDPATPTVRIDPGQWTQVLLNLAVNARDAMPTGGVVRISTRRPLPADLAAFTGAGDHALLEVEDDGPGMPPEVCERIFEPFFTTKGRAHGTGLGLAVVYGVVRQAGGRIEVDSQPGRGTRFTVWLPAATEAPRRAAPVAARPQQHAGTEKVLVVEDDPSVRALLRRILASRGYQVTVTSDGDEALRALDGFAPDLLLTDVVMPNLDGPGLVARATARNPGLRVLYSSGHVEAELVRSGLVRDGVAFLPKPYTPVQLLARVRDVLDREVDPDPSPVP